MVLQGCPHPYYIQRVSPIGTLLKNVSKSERGACEPLLLIPQLRENFQKSFKKCLTKTEKTAIIIYACCGGVTQLARVVGSYPTCHPFESDRRYQNSLDKQGSFSFALFRIRGLGARGSLCEPCRAVHGREGRSPSLAPLSIAPLLSPKASRPPLSREKWGAS